MVPEWFHPVAQQLKNRINSGTKRIEFVTGVRINAVPHIGTYLTLASTFIYASLAFKAVDIPCSVHIHFLDNDPAISSSRQNTHFHCVFQKRTDEETTQFLDTNYFAYLSQLASITNTSFTQETYSLTQSKFNFRSAVIRSLARWKDFKYYVSGPAIVGSPSGVRGIGSPCPQCGLFEGWVRPTVDVDGDRCVLEASCPDHGQFCSVLTPSNMTFINLETTYRNVIKEILTLQNSEVLSVMMKGLDWQEGIRNVNSVLEVLGADPNITPLRFLVPVVKTNNGTKLSKSAIQRYSDDFQGVRAFFLDMSLFRNHFSNYPELLVQLSKFVLTSSTFRVRPVYPEDLLLYLER